MYRFGADDGLCRYKQVGCVCDAGRVCAGLRCVHLFGGSLRNGHPTQRRYQLMRAARAGIHALGDARVEARRTVVLVGATPMLVVVKAVCVHPFF